MDAKKMPAATIAAIEAEITELEKARERLVSELFQTAGRSERPLRVVLEEIGHHPEIVKIDAALEALSVRQARTMAQSTTR